MKFNKITLLLAIMIISILAVGAVSAESVDDATISADDSDLTVATADSDINDVSAADDAADDAVGDDGNAVLGDDAASYDLDDDSYSTYFNEDGTATDALSEMGDYTLNVGTLTNKDIKIVSGSNINIIGKEGAGIINNGTIVIGDGTGYAGSILVSGLTFTNTNKNAVEILDLSSDITIKGNTMNIEGVAPEDNPYFSIYGVNANGYISGLKIEDNTISVKGNAPYSYGIQLGSYGAISNPENIVISNNAIYVNVEDCMAEAIYLDNPNNVVVEANNVTVSNTGDYCAYGIQISDSAQYVYYEAGYEGALTSAKNVLIKDNFFAITSDFMVYGITVLDFGVSGYDEDMADYGYNMPATYQFDLNTTISGNTVYGVSKKGVIGIGGQTYNMTVVGNDVTAIGISAENMTTGDALRNHTSAICVQYNGANADDDYFIVVNDNKITTNVIPEEINSKDYLGYVTFKNNNRTLIVDDVEYTVVDADNYAQFFDESGEYINDVEDIALGDLTGKSLVFGSKVNVVGVPGSKLTNVNIDLTADGIVVDGLTFEFEGVPGGWNGLIHVGLGVKDITISNNDIKIVGTGTGTVMAIVIPGSNDSITENINVIGNVIDITGVTNKNLYAVDAFSYDYPYKGVSSKNLNIVDNNVTIKGSTSMAEAFYISWVDDSTVSGNIVSIESNANAYGIGSDNVNNVVFNNNEFDIKSVSDTGASYGITIAPGSGVTANDNTMTVEGVSAIGIGLASGSDAVLNGNVINVVAGDYSSLTPSTSIGVGDEEIKLNDNTDAVVNGTEYKIADGVEYIVFDGVDHVIVDADNYDQFFDGEGKYISDAEGIALSDFSSKDFTFASPISVVGVPGAKLTDVTIKLTADASGSSIDGLTIVYEGADLSYSHGIIDIMGGAKDIALSNNVINVTATNEGGTAMAICLSGNIGDNVISNITISGNEINMNGTAKYLYAVDAFSNNWASDDAAVSGIEAYDNEINLEGTYYVAGFYLSHTADSNIHDNEINGLVTGADSGVAYGIASDCASNMTYDDNTINIEAVSNSSTIWGIQAAPSYSGTPSTDITVTNNDITLNGASAIGVGINGGNATIKDNTIDITAADDETVESISTYDTVGTGNSGVKLTGNATADVSGNYIDSNQNNMDLAGASSDTKVGSNYVMEYVEKEGDPDLPAAPKATSITVQSATVTADPNGKSKTKNIAITVKDANGNPVAGQTIQVYVNGALKTAKTNDKGVATLAVPYKAGGTVSLVASFNGATGLLGSSATGKLTVKKNAVKIAAKTKKVKKSKAKKAKVKFTLKVGKTALKKKAVTIKINKKTYKAKTNAKGIATFKVKLPKKAKKYKFTVKFAGDNFNKAKTFKGKLTVK